MAATTPSFGEYEFTDNHHIKDYCKRVRKATHMLGLEIAMAGAELQAALGQVPPAQGSGVLGLGQKWRARQVASHLNRAAEALKAAAASATRTYAAFRRHYAPELDAVNGRRKSRPRFEFKPE